MHACDEGMHAWDEGVCWLGPSIPWNHSDNNAYLSSESDDRVTTAANPGDESLAGFGWALVPLSVTAVWVQICCLCYLDKRVDVLT